MGSDFLTFPPAPAHAARERREKVSRNRKFSGLAPDALLVAVSLGAFPAFVLVHLETTLFLEITHDLEWCVVFENEARLSFFADRL